MDNKPPLLYIRLMHTTRKNLIARRKNPAPSQLTDPAQFAAQLILESAGENLAREGIQRTPERFRKAMATLTEGYRKSARDVIGEGIFAAEGRGLVSVRDVEFYSLCEHHLLPFWGKVSVAYYPGTQILGLSKIPRIVDVFARRFQVQERLTREVAEAIAHEVAPRAIVVRARAQHLCMMMRGVEKQGSDTLTEFAIGLDRLDAHEKERIWNSVE